MAAIAPPPGWYTDPAGRHQRRYWDGGAWSSYVVDQGHQSADPIEAGLNGGTRLATPTTGWPAGTGAGTPAGAKPAGTGAGIPWRVQPAPPLGAKPPGTPAAPSASAWRRIHWGWWVALLVAAFVGGSAFLIFSGVFRNRCGDAGPGANLSGCSLRHGQFQRENLKRANFTQADLRRANFKGTRLNAANFTGSDLRRANLKGSQLNGADLTGARVKGATFAGASLAGATLRRTHGLESANLLGARGLSDHTLAVAFGVGPQRLPTYLAAHGVQLEAPGVIGSALRQVCGGGSMPQAAARPNGTVGVVGGRNLGNQSYQAPKSWAPVDRRYASRVACFSSQTTAVETCYYSLTGFGPASPVDRVENVISVNVRNAHSGQQLGSTSFTGGYPRECPEKLPWGTDRIWGSAVSSGAITHWLAQWRG
ncbi:MAG: pentapeptide repeat-containing protein [Solirubrobacterales bacterium]